MGPQVGHGNVEALFLGVNCGNFWRDDAKCLQCAFGFISLLNAKHQLITKYKLKNQLIFELQMVTGTKN